MKRCVVVGGADIGSYEYVRSLLSEEDFFVFCDSGLKHMDRLGVRPSLIVGDFDSHENPHLEAETIVLPREKDDTDTVYGVKEALRRRRPAGSYPRQCIHPALSRRGREKGNHRG